jgi:hypothetical protein
MVSLQSQGKARRDFGDRTERVRIGEIADERGKRIDLGRSKNPAERGPSLEKKIGGVAVISLKKFFELREWLHDSGGVSV